MENRDRSLADKLFPYWFYPALIATVLASVFIGYSMLWVAWQILKIILNWLVNR